MNTHSPRSPAGLVLALISSATAGSTLFDNPDVHRALVLVLCTALGTLGYVIPQAGAWLVRRLRTSDPPPAPRKRTPTLPESDPPPAGDEEG
jgi:uncharacterized membrane protein